MHLTFDESFDTGFWPGPGGAPAKERGAAVGKAWVGHSGFLGILEGLTGLGRVWPSRVSRVATLVSRVTSMKGFWSASAKTDALSTAERLVQLRDELTLHGWQGPVGSARLDALAELVLVPELGGSPGERYAELASMLREFPRVIERVTLLEPRASLPKRLRECLDVLEQKGTAVVVEVPKRAGAPKGSDLLHAKSGARFSPKGDGTVQLVRPFAPMLAADAVAAALAADPDATTLVIGADAVLDQALARNGLPTVGGAGDPSDNALLQVLPLVIAMGQEPQDPQRVVELLTLADSPVPKSLSRRLVGALQEWPAVGSPDWDEALAEGLLAIEDVDARKRYGERVGAIFSGSVTSSSYPRAELAARIQLLRKWLIGRQGHVTSDDARARVDAAVIQCNELERLLDQANLTSLPAAQLKLFLEDATASVDGSARYPACAGLRAVADPGGVAGPVERVLWWSFTADGAPAPRGSIWSKAELDALDKAGVRVPSAGEQATSLAARFRRPLEQATQSLWLVCPERGADGGDCAPHPLWDEVLGLLDKGSHESAMCVEVPRVNKPLAHKKRAALALPAPRVTWTTKAKLTKRETESASSIEGFLACELRWALHYVGKLRGGDTAALPADNTLLGSLAHEVIGQTLDAKPASPAAAADDVARRFHELGPKLAASLFLPGKDAGRARTLQAARAAAERLAALLEEGWKVEGVEKCYAGTALGTALEGRLDLVLKKGKARAVIDLKWTGASYKEGDLVDGVAVQLAVYAELLRQSGDSDVAVAYFIIDALRLLSADPRLAGDGAALAVKKDMHATWSAVESAWRAAWKSATAGTLRAPGAPFGGGTKSKQRRGYNDDGALVMVPVCGLCDFGGLCGRCYAKAGEDTHGED